MIDIHEEHEQITAIVKQSIESMRVVFPSTYGKIYSDIARNRDIELNPDEILTSEMMDERIVRHVVTLSTCTDQAIVAIEKKDKHSLQAILVETKALRDEIQELRKVVYEDSLTKSFNRKWFDDTYLGSDKLLLREEGTIVIVDLNDFKGINDSYGHNIGDKVLLHIAIKLKESGGRVVRYGGDEFLVIFDSAVPQVEIRSKLDNILAYFRKISFKVNEHNFKISFAYGMAQFKQGSTLETVIDTADKAMYLHKKEEKHHG